MSNEEIEDYIEKLEREYKSIKDEILRICWYMRGSISYSDSMLLTIQDREIINKILKDNLEATNKSGIAFI